MTTNLKHFRIPALAILLLLFFPFAGFSDEKPVPLLELSLYTGIPGLASLGQTQKQVEKIAKIPFERVSIEPDTPLGKLRFTEVFLFKSIGTKVYFKRDGAGLITAQEPFKGTIKGKKVKLFAFSVPPVSDWETLLIKELGPPESRSSGGRFGSEALYYNWGDMSYNRMGPNEIALYRNPELSKYRLTNFGREVELFPLK